MVLILEPKIKDVKKINIIGKKLIKVKNIKFLSLGFIFILIFFIINLIKKKKGIKIPNCLRKKISGYLKWLINSFWSIPVLSMPYLIVTKSLLPNQIKCGINIIIKISQEIIYLKSNLIFLLIKIEKKNRRLIDINK